MLHYDILIDNCNDLGDLAIIYRGVILEFMVNIEERIDWMISNYYFDIKLKDKLYEGVLPLFVGYSDELFTYNYTNTEEKREEFTESILEHKNFSLDFKFQVLKYLIEKYCKEYIKEYPIINKLQNLISVRNAFAHRKINVRLSNIESKEVVVSYHPNSINKHGSETMNKAKLLEFIENVIAIQVRLKECDKILLSKK
jgi:hypothetical protein